MPRLLVVVACSRAILAQDDNRLSIIDVFENITIPVPSGRPIPDNANAQAGWSLVTLWQQEPNDEERVFEYRISLLQPDNQVVREAIHRASLADIRYRLMMGGQGFPVAQEGVYRFVIAWRRADTDDDWREVGDYPVNIIHELIEEDQGEEDETQL